MKIKELTIDHHKGFNDFTIDFDQNSSITTIIGQNGVGKSNLIEIIIKIFRSLDLNESLDFSYTIRYECRQHQIQVRYDHLNAKNHTVNIDNVKKSLAFIKTNANEYLPLNIFTYYSGTNERVEELFLKHQTQFYKALTTGDDRLVRRFESVTRSV